jgi:hypothetical protein
VADVADMSWRAVLTEETLGWEAGTEVVITGRGAMWVGVLFPPRREGEDPVKGWVLYGLLRTPGGGEVLPWSDATVDDAFSAEADRVTSMMRATTTVLGPSLPTIPCEGCGGTNDVRVTHRPNYTAALCRGCRGDG